VNYCLILVSDSIMVPCYGRNTLNTKGCVVLVFSTLEIHFLFFKNEFREGTYPPSWGVRVKKRLAKSFFLTIEKSLGKASCSGEMG